MCIHYLGTSSPLYLLVEPVPPSCSIVFLKNIAVLLDCDIARYTGRFLVLVPRKCVLQPKLVLYQTSSLLLSPQGLCQFKIIIFGPIQGAYQPQASFWLPSLSLSLPYTVSPSCVTHAQYYFCIRFSSIIHIWRRTCDFWPSEHDWLCLRWCSPDPFIYLKIRKFHSSLWLNKIPLRINATLS
jgi:hypothetical protein